MSTRELTKRLAWVRRFDRARAEDPVRVGRLSHDVFGAGKHAYRSTPLAEEELVALERELGVALPGEYREFLREIGWGAGPYYGLLSPQRCLEETRDLAEAYDERLAGHPSDPFPLSADDATRLRARELEGKSVERVARYPRGGFLCIAEQGCEGYTALVLTGDFAGSIWDFWYGVAAYPAHRAPGRLHLPQRDYVRLPQLPIGVSFAQWYDAWLERCLVDFGRGPT